MPWKEMDAMNQRVEFVMRALRTENFRELCREYGISAKSGYKWKERFLEHGLNGMMEESRRPKSSPRGLDEAVVCEIIRLKERRRHWGRASCGMFIDGPMGKRPVRAASSGC